jgi:hypothetical protein
MSARAWRISGVLVLAVLAGLAWAIGQHFTGSPKTAHLVFTPTFGGKPLVFNRFAYANPAGEQSFRVEDFRFYVSNVMLIGAGGVYQEPDSYHLARFDGPDVAHRIELKDIPIDDLAAVAFSVGVDAAANGSIESRGDLDPNSRMAWNWEVGYKFVLIEGSIKINGQLRPLVYHVGFIENRRDFRDGAEIRFAVDLKKVFDGETQIDMARLQSVKFDKSDAKRLADNYAGMFAPHW